MNTFTFHQIFMGFRNNSIKKYKDIFDKLKDFLKAKLVIHLDSIIVVEKEQLIWINS